MKRFLSRSCVLAWLLVTVSVQAQTIAPSPVPAAAPTAVPAPAPMTVPGMTGPLAANPRPTSLSAGPFGPVFITGVVSGYAQFQNNVSPGDRAHFTDVSNAQVFVQKPSGAFQFYLQAGEYSTPDIGLPYTRAEVATSALFGPVPQVFVKFLPTEALAISIGKLPTLIGAEYTWSFENMNIERGLLWNQENAVNRGVQVNLAEGRFNFAVSLNDGMYSNHYSWIWFSVAATLDSSNSLSLIGGGNTRYTNFSTAATPLYLNNEQIYNLIYTHVAGAWTIEPYLQHTRVPMKRSIGALHAASTSGAALFVSYACDAKGGLGGVSLPIRLEYITSEGTVANGAPNLLYGAGSKAWSFTVTPTYQHGIFFARAEYSFVGASNTTAGAVFGPLGTATSQSRVALESGIVF